MNQLPINFKRSIGFKKNFGEIHVSQGLAWVFLYLSLYSILVKGIP